MSLQKTRPPLIAASPSLRAARRFLRDHKPGDHSTLYRVYVAVICAVFLGAPGIWSAVGAFALLGQSVEPVIMVSALHAIGAVFVALTAFIPSHAGLVVPTGRELFYFVDGPFGVRATLTPRTVMFFLLLASAGGLVAGVAAAGLGLENWAVVAAVASGLGLGGIAAGSLVVRQSTFALRGQWVFAAAGALLCAASTWFSGTGVFPLALSAVELSAAVVLGVLIPVLLDRVMIGRLEADMASRDALMAGLMAGDSRAFASVPSGKIRRFRRLRTTYPAAPLLRALRVDALSVLRTPARTGAALLAGAATGALTGAAGGNLLAVALALVVLEHVFTVFAKGLLDYLDTVGADRIAPDPFWGTALRHIVLPWALLVLCTGFGFLATVLFAPVGTPVPLALVLVLSLPLCVTIMLSGSAGAPVRMLAPVLTPVGDASSLALVLWMLRGLIPAGLFMLISLKAGLAVGAGILIPCCAAAAFLRMRSLGGVEENSAGHVWRKA